MEERLIQQTIQNFIERNSGLGTEKMFVLAMIFCSIIFIFFLFIAKKSNWKFVISKNVAFFVSISFLLTSLLINLTLGDQINKVRNLNNGNVCIVNAMVYDKKFRVGDENNIYMLYLSPSKKTNEAYNINISDDKYNASRYNAVNIGDDISFIVPMSCDKTLKSLTDPINPSLYNSIHFIDGPYFGDKYKYINYIESIDK